MMNQENGLRSNNDSGMPRRLVNNMAMAPPAAETALKMTKTISPTHAIVFGMFARMVVRREYRIKYCS